MAKIGRPAGSLNRNRIDIWAIAKKKGVDPFEILLDFAKGDAEALGYQGERVISVTASGQEITGPWITPELRARAASDACEYLHPKLKGVELSGPDGKPIETRSPLDLSKLSKDELLIIEKALGSKKD